MLRKEVCDRLENQWKEIIQKYDQQKSSRGTTLMQYQKLQNVYTVEVNKSQLGTGIISYGWALISLILLAALACGIWTYRHRTTLVVRAAQPLFLILISIGVFVFGASIIPMAIDDGHFSVEACDRACMAVPWLVSAGWSILFSALYAKIRRVNLVVHNVTNFKQVKVSERDVMTPFAIIFSANLILLVIWTVIDPLFWERVEVSKTESYGTCSADSDSVAWKIMVALLSALNGAALIGANVEAWKARKIDTEYGESSYIGLIMASILQVVLVGVPLTFLVKDNPTARFFVNSSMAFVISMSALSLLFIPKVITVHQNSRRKKGAIKSNNSQVSHSMTEAALMNDLKSKVKTLQNLLQEAGIDGTVFIQQSGLDNIASPANSGAGRLSSLDRDVESICGAESSRFDSLPPVVEEEDEDHKELGVNMERSDDLVENPNPPRSSISTWLKQKRTSTPTMLPSTEPVSISAEHRVILDLPANTDTNTSLKARIEESMRGTT